MPNQILVIEFWAKQKRIALLLCKEMGSSPVFCLSQPQMIYEGFYNSGSKVGSLTRLGCEQGLHSFHLVSGGSMAATLLISKGSNLPFGIREGHGGWCLTCKKWGTKGLYLGAPQDSALFH